jgi:tetratricopeptide (TPR) repeat protein
MSTIRLESHDFSSCLKIFLIFLIFCAALCIPVSGLANSSSENTIRLTALKNATDYESQGKSLMAERDWSGVINITGTGLRFYPYNPELLCLQAYALRKTGHYQESVDLISIAIPNDTRPVRYANRGYGFLAMGKTDDAIQDADSALALNASYATAYSLKASALRMTGNLSAAEDTIGKAIQLDPDNAYYLHVKGGILADKGDCNGATDAFRHSIAINADYDLPWPGLSNATVDLEHEEARCAQGSQTSPTKATFPVAIVFFAGIIAFVQVSRQV